MIGRSRSTGAGRRKATGPIVQFDSEASPLWQEILKRLEYPATVMRRDVRPMLLEPSNYARPDRLVRDPMPGNPPRFGPGYIPYATTPRITKRGTLRFFWRRPFAPEFTLDALLEAANRMRDYFLVRGDADAQAAVSGIGTTRR
jgi:hypothetical protein